MSADVLDAELARKVERLADEFALAGFIVTRQLEVEMAGAARFLCVSPRTLRNWRSVLGEDGPPYRQHKLRTWYPIRGLLQWDPTRRFTERVGTVLDDTAPPRAE